MTAQGQVQGEMVSCTWEIGLGGKWAVEHEIGQGKWFSSKALDEAGYQRFAFSCFVLFKGPGSSSNQKESTSVLQETN